MAEDLVKESLLPSLDVPSTGSIISTSLSEATEDLEMGLKNVEISWLGLLLAFNTLPGKDFVLLGSTDCFLGKVFPGVESQPPPAGTHMTSLSLSLFADVEPFSGDEVAVSRTIGSSVLITGRVWKGRLLF